MPLNRRDALTAIAVTASGGLLMSRTAFAQETGANAAQTAALLQGTDVCAITPEVTEGPYYFDPALERVDITEGRPGIPLRMRLQVVDERCAAIAGARVDIWHCDATGIYSGYAGQGDDRSLDTTGQTFMRGTQFADASGIVAFETVYPSWYSGRTTHIHFKVFISETTVLTGQIFFPDAMSEYIYLNVAPYNGRARERDTLNANDGIARQAGRASYAFIKELDDAYVAAMIIGVDPKASSGEGGIQMPRGARGTPPRGNSGRQPGGDRGAGDRSAITPAVKG